MSNYGVTVFTDSIGSVSQQSGFVDVTGVAGENFSSNTVTINAVNLDNAFLLFNPPGLKNVDGNAPTNYYFNSYITLEDSTTVKGEYYNEQSVNQEDIPYQVIELEGLSSVQRGFVDCSGNAGGTQIFTKTISSVNMSKSLLFFNGIKTNIVNDPHDVDIVLLNDTTLQVTRSLGNPGVYELYYSLIEFE